jgi:imidazolonepropionase-like amidohydrolase
MLLFCTSTLARRSFVALVLWASGAMQIALAETVLLRAERVIADPRVTPLGPTTIVVRDGRIVEMLPGKTASPSVAPPAGEPITDIDLGTRTVLPGLIDSHVHLQNEYGVPWWSDAARTPEYLVAVALKNAAATLRAGFTTVRDLGSDRLVMFAVRDAIRDGVAIGPRVVVSGPAISVPGGHGDVTGFRPDVNRVLGNDNTCTGPVECANRVRELAHDGANLIKVTVTGGVLSLQARGFEQHFTDDELKAIVEAAKLLGLKTAAHAHGARGVEAAARAGFDSIEHAVFADDKALQAMKARGTYLVPTLSTTQAYRERIGTGFYAPQVEAKAKQRLAETGKSIVAARRMGVKMAFGTDAGVYRHGVNANEFGLLAEYAAFTPREALESATVNASDLLGLSDQIGTLAAGKSADVVAVDGDPLRDIRAMERVTFVMARGAVVAR